MRPWVSDMAGYKIINFAIFHDRVGKLMERIFSGERYLTLVINETAFSDAILTVMEEKLWLPNYLNHVVVMPTMVIKNVKLYKTERCAAGPTISLLLGNDVVTISQTVGNLGVSFPVSKFVEEAIRYLEEDPVIALCDTAERQKDFEEKWQKMLSELEDQS